MLELSEMWTPEHGPLHETLGGPASEILTPGKSGKANLVFLLFLFPSFPHHHAARAMESLSDTKWDVVISGTGLQQSLLAL
jgi:hypothetical protein